MLKKILKNKQQDNQPKQDISEDDVKHAKHVIDNVFTPRLKRDLDKLNEYLKERGIRAGIEVQWFFDKE